ncbi:MAG: YbaN family protein, partial [Clostridiales bacterium]|nr:YbaN family protein [Clostridiales bacterium]
SDRFHKWFLGTKLYKKHLEGFVKNRSMTMKTKLAICIPVSAMLLVAIYFAPIWHAQVLIGAVLLFKWYYFLFRIKTVPPRLADGAGSVGND